MTSLASVISAPTRARHVNVVPLCKVFTGIVMAGVHLFCIRKLDNYLSKYITVSSE